MTPVPLTEAEFNTIMLRAARFCNVPIPHCVSAFGAEPRVFVRGEKYK